MPARSLHHITGYAFSLSDPRGHTLKAERVIVVHHTHTHYYFIRSPERKSRLDSAALWIECVRWTLRARFALSLTCSTHKNDGTHRLYGFSFEFCVHTSSRTEKNRIEQTTYSVLIIRSCETSIYRFCVERSFSFTLKPLVNQTYTSSSSIEHAQRRDHTINSDSDIFAGQRNHLNFALLRMQGISNANLFKYLQK